MQSVFKIGDFVSCPRLGPGPFEVVGEDGSEFILRDMTGITSTIFKVHVGRLSAPEHMRLRRERTALRIASAAKIGLPKTKPGRR